MPVNMLTEETEEATRALTGADTETREEAEEQRGVDAQTPPSTDEEREGGHGEEVKGRREGREGGRQMKEQSEAPPTQINKDLRTEEIKLQMSGSRKV